MEISGLQTFCWSAHTEQSVWKWFPKYRWKISILINANFCVLGELSCCRRDSIPFGHAEANSDEYSNFAKENSLLPLFTLVLSCNYCCLTAVVLMQI